MNQIFCKIVKHLAAWTLLVTPVITAEAGSTDSTMSYQGELRANGARFDGSADFKVILVDDAEMTLWSNDGTSTTGDEPTGSIAVQVNDGVFSILLGALLMIPLDASVVNDSPSVFQRVWVDTGTGFEQLTPDFTVSSTPRSLHSETADGAAMDFLAPGEIQSGLNSIKIQGSSNRIVTDDAGGLFYVGGSPTLTNIKFGVGMATPQRAVHVRGDVMLLDRDEADPSIFIRRYDSGFNNAWKSFGLVNNASGPNNGKFSIRDSGAGGVGGGTDRLVIDNDGNVGIATSDPAPYRFNIKQASNNNQSGLRIQNLSADKSLQAWVGTGGAVIDAEGTSYLRLRTAGQDRVHINNSNGNVGIGTVSPAVKLHIDGSANAAGQVVRVDNDDNFGTWLQLNNTATGGDTWNLISAGPSNGEGAGSLVFNNSTTRMLIKPDGKVGIGTVAPERDLHVRGDILLLDRDGADPSLFIRRFDSGFTTAWKSFGLVNNASGPNNGKFSIRDSGAGGVGGGTDRLVIDNDGNVGIATSDPSPYRLSIKESSDNGIQIENAAGTKSMHMWVGANAGNVEAEGTTDLQLRAGGDVRMFIDDATGDVGLGTLTPQGQIHVRRTGSVKLFLEADTDDNGEGDQPSIEFSQDGGGITSLVGFENTDNNLILSVTNNSGNSQIRLLPDTNVNIEAAGSQGEQLRLVNGNDTQHYAALGVNTGSDLFIQTHETGVGANGDIILQAGFPSGSFAGGQVGIGTSSPAFKLEVIGNVRISGNLDLDGDLNQPSDRRFKKNIAPIDSGLDKIVRLRGVSYEWDRASSPQKPFDEGQRLGLIAQEVAEVLPELTHQRKDGMLTLNYNGVVPVLVEAIKEQQKIIDSTQTELDGLKARLAALESAAIAAKSSTE